MTRRFRNAEPVRDDFVHAIGTAFRTHPDRAPHRPLPVVRGDAARFDTPPPSGLRLTWFGHSSMLLEADGARLLIDPMWGERASPVPFAGPRRWYPPPLALDALPAVDAVVISHDHYDHLDRGTIAALAPRVPRFVVPLGVGARLRAWGVPPAHVEELDWWGATTVRGVEVVATPARHASGRSLVDRDSTLWAGFAFLGPRHRVYYSGDSGASARFAEIGARLGPFDLTLLQIGAYADAWPDWHLTPEAAVDVHRAVRGGVLLPVHWGLFTLAFHPWSEPIERLFAAAKHAGVRVATPRPGESVEPETVGEPNAWWDAVRGLSTSG